MNAALRTLAVVAILAAALLGARVAAAQPAPATPSAADRAQALFVEGQKHYDLSEWDDAIAAFKEAYRLDAQPEYLYNLAQVYRKKGDCADARTLYQSYLRNAPDGDKRPQAERRVAEMDACLRAHPPPEPATPSTTVAPIGGGTAGVQTTATIERDHPRRRLAGMITSGAGVVVLAAAVGFSLQARHFAREVETTCQGGCDGADISFYDEHGHRDDRVATGLYVGGGLAVAAGIGLYVWGRGHDVETAPVALVPIRGGAIVARAWSF